MSSATPDTQRFAATKHASYTGYVVQAIVNNLAPLLFVIFNTQYSIPLAQLGLISTLNFAIQLLVDLISTFLVDKAGYRVPIVLAHVFAVIGLLLMAILPTTMHSAFLGLCIAVAVYAVGGGLIEVLVSPIIEHLPTPADRKASAMAMLHSFYCWGQLAVVIGTTALLSALGTSHWAWLPVIWAIVPFANIFVLLRVPMPKTVAENDRTPLHDLFGTPLFLAALVLMMTGGAAELTMVQWSSFFVEKGIGISKEIGDLLGPGLFALLMGTGRFAYGIWGESIDLRKMLLVSSLGAAACYLIAAISPIAIISLLASALCGLMVALLWPGTFSLTSSRFPLGGAAMFAILALAGDAGGSIGPSLAGIFAQAAHGPLSAIARLLPSDGGSGLRTALLLCALIPAIFAITVWRFDKNPARPRTS